MTTALFAHSRPPPFGEETWEPLEHHLNRVADLAGEFARSFGGGDIASIAGLLHDLGKAKPKFQAYLRGLVASEPHATAGAKFCADRFGDHVGRMLAFCIAGHHAGLANGVGEGERLTPLSERLKSQPNPFVPNWLAVPDMPEARPGPFASPMTDVGGSGQSERSFAVAFFVRMIFSCLVDADFLATEEFYTRAEGREVDRGWAGSLATLKANLDRRLDQFGPPETEVARLRADVLAAARACASSAPGLFTLTVPTGGGKTLASLSFALDHAIAHGLKRVIYVIPFTSIIEQTADVFRGALNDDDAVLEHHSAFDWEGLNRTKKSVSDDDEGLDGIEKLRLAAQNWDRPVVVTTAVQFFESLFANRTSRCRKLHNLAKSVIVLDEAQTLPLKLLRPCLAALKELARGYGSSVVLCTATQPAILKEDGFKPAEALSRNCAVLPVREIAQDPAQLYERLRRVCVSNVGALDDSALAERLTAQRQVLCIVNTRAHARDMFALLRHFDDAGARHLSTAMTAVHRRNVLDEIRRYLVDGKPVRLVSTSLVEAGVDISFPAVYRAIAGIDSIAQAAGRCNRNGELGRDGGALFVFDPGDAAGRRPPPELKQFAATAAKVMSDHRDPLALDAVRAYFGELFWRRGEDQLDGTEVGAVKGVMRAIRENARRLDFPFESIAQAFRIIETAMVPVIIPATPANAFGAPADLLSELRFADRPGKIARRLQTFLVNIPAKARAALVASGAAEVLRQAEFGDQFVVLANNELYDAKRGLDWSDPTFRSAESLLF